MSVEKLAIYKSIGTALGSGSETDCYTCPSDTKMEVTEIRVAHNAGTAGVAKVIWYDASSTTNFTILFSGTVPLNNALVINPLPLHLEAGDKIKVTGASGQHVIVTGLQEPVRRST